MKKMTEIKDEASVFRLLYTLIMNRILVGSALETVAGTIKSFDRPLMAIIHDFREADSKEASLGAAFERQAEHFSEFVPELFRSVKTARDFVEACWEVSRIVGRASRLLQSGSDPEKVGHVNFYRVLSAMIRKGPGIIKALHISGAQCLDAADVAKLAGSVKEGETISGGMKATGRFSEMDMSMMLVGEETGTVPDVCEFLADIKEQELLLEAPSRSVATEQDRMISMQSLFEVEHLAIMINAGLPLGYALKRFIKGLPDESRRQVYQLLKEKIEAGATPSEAMTDEKFFSEFPGYVIILVKWGERRRELEVTFRRLAEHIKWELFGLEPKHEALTPE